MAKGNSMTALAQILDSKAIPLHQAMAQYGQGVDLSDDHFMGRYNTALTPKDEAAYQQWSKENNRLQDTIDYDMRGAWQGNIGQSGNGHYPDTFKKPNHPTFSNQSMYHGAPNPNGGQFVGGNWDDAAQGKHTFTPSLEMVSKPGYVNFMQDRYMPKVEPGNIFNMDRR